MDISYSYSYTPPMVFNLFLYEINQSLYKILIPWPSCVAALGGEGLDDINQLRY